MTFWVHETACSTALPGATHLATLETLAELSELALSIGDAGTETEVFAGAVQDPGAALPDVGWIHFNGAPVSPAHWKQGEPDDDANGEIDHEMQVAAIERASDRLVDAAGTVPHAAVCECDGTSIAAMARTFVDTDPNNPN